MKVLHVEAGRYLYGGAQQVVWLNEGLARRGVENVLVCPTGSDIATAVAGIYIIEKYDQMITMDCCDHYQY